MPGTTRVRLVSFADGPFAPRAVRFCWEAARMELFDEIRVYNAARLPAAFRYRHLRYMQTHRRGFGYWIWKPQVILAALQDSAPGDQVVYLDVGFTLNRSGRPRLQEYLEIAQDSRQRMLSFQSVHTEAHWTKGDLAHRLSVQNRPAVMNTSQLSSGFLILGNTPENLALVQQWQMLATESSYRYSDDSPSRLPNHPEFCEHRHDQSISSLLRKLRGTAVTHYEVQPYDKYFMGQRRRLPAWATRSRR